MFPGDLSVELHSLGRELGRYGVDIAALSETRFADESQLQEIGAGYTFFGSDVQQPSTDSLVQDLLYDHQWFIGMPCYLKA